MAGQNFYGTLTVDVTAEADDIFNDTTKIYGSDITRGNAFLGEIASAITGDVYMENGSTLTKVALDKTAGKGETFTGSDITFDGLKSLKHYVPSGVVVWRAKRVCPSFEKGRKGGCGY